MGGITYEPEQVTKALLALAHNSGDAEKTAEELHDADFQVSKADLLLWKHDVHAEQYKRLAKAVGLDHEERTAATLRETIAETSRIKRDLLAKVEETAKRPELAGHALRAVTDAEAKSVNSLLALTGRPTDGRQDGGAESMARLVMGLVDRGLVSMAPGLSLEPKRVPNEAEASEDE